jgi:hypothetical protein
MPNDTLDELIDSRVAVEAAELHLAKLSPDDAGRRSAEAALERARERYAQAMRAQEEKARRPR